MKRPERLMNAWQEQNKEAAMIIAANPTKYSAVLQEWAALVLTRAIGPLFAGRAA